MCACACDTVERPSNEPIDTCSFVIWKGSPPLRFKTIARSIMSVSIPYHPAPFHTVCLYPYRGIEVRALEQKILLQTIKPTDNVQYISTAKYVHIELHIMLGAVP